MIDWLRRLLGLHPASRPAAGTFDAQPGKPALPDADFRAFTEWYAAQRKPAIALRPDPEAPTGARGSRLGGPAFIPQGESWPLDPDGVPLEHIAQLDLADCAPLDGYPRHGVVQFFIGRDDVFGMDFEDLFAGKRLVRLVDPDAPGALHAPPPLEEVGGTPFSDYSPFLKGAERTRGVALMPELVEDRMDYSVHEVEQRVGAFYREYTVTELEDFIEEEAAARPPRHNSGGYPAFTQTDIRADARYADLDHTLLRLTSDDHLMWGDAGECVFMMRGADLARGDFSRVAYSWDCC